MTEQDIKKKNVLIKVGAQNQLGEERDNNVAMSTNEEQVLQKAPMKKLMLLLSTNVNKCFL